MAAHLTEPPPAPSRLRPGLPAALDTVIAIALAKQPADRYSSCAELADAAAVAIVAAGTGIARHSIRPARPAPDAETRSDDLVSGSVWGASEDDAMVMPISEPTSRLITGPRLVIGCVVAILLASAGYLGAWSFDVLPVGDKAFAISALVTAVAVVVFVAAAARRVVVNEFDDNGGIFVMFEDNPVPGEPTAGT